MANPMAPIVSRLPPTSWNHLQVWAHLDPSDLPRFPARCRRPRKILVAADASVVSAYLIVVGSLRRPSSDQWCQYYSDLRLHAHNGSLGQHRAAALPIAVARLGYYSLHG